MDQPGERPNRKLGPSRVSKHTALAVYLSEIEHIPVLAVEDERALARRMRRGDEKSRNELVRRNLRFVVTVARQYMRFDVPLEDLINEGNLGLIRATRTFDPNRGFRFISYAVWWIRQSILSYITNQSRVVRIPAGQIQRMSRLARETERLMQECGCIPATDQLARRLEISPEQVEDLHTLPTFGFSLDEPAEGAHSDFEVDVLEDPSANLDDKLLTRLRHHDVRVALDVLDPRESDIIRRHYGLSGVKPESLQCIGRSYGVTRERVRQLRDRALWKLRTSEHHDQLAEYAS